MGKSLNAAASGAGLIEQIIKKYVEENNVVFVFPTEIAAAMWQERALDFHPQKALPDERFLPWDRFKGIHAAKAEAGKAEIQERVRELYAENLGKRNAAAAKKGKPLLRSAIPEEFAESYSTFAPWIASILPHLALYEEKSVHTGEADAEARDVAFILEDYKAFLDRSKLYEPSWCRRFEGGGKKHIIFFYEAIQGFSAHETALKPKYVNAADELPSADELADFTAVSAPCFEGEAAQFELHTDFREEFRRVALKIEKLLMRGEPSDTIAVSLADAEESEPYLARELKTRGIPFRVRIKRALAESNAGRLFPLIQQCNAENLSFNSVKKLLSLKSVAWSKPELPASLIQFGIENRCICSWREGAKAVDIWERMFDIADRAASFRIKNWYLKLKWNVQALASAKTFADARARWFAFRDSLLDAEKMGFGEGSGKEGKTKESLEIGRCIAELDELVEAEKAYPELTPRNPFSFFVARLKKTTYVPLSKAGGVSVFKYKDAAAAPFKFHFITGATQEDATAQHTELRFLRKDKRDELKCLDEDASLEMFSSYINGAENGGNVFFSASKRGVGGYKTVHSAFAARADKDEKNKKEELPDDPLEMEERQERPSRIYPVQRDGFAAYSGLNGDKATRFSFLKEGFEGNADADALLHIRERLAKKQKEDGRASVSPTDLNAFAECPAKWLLERALKLEESDFSLELAIADARKEGTLLHEVFKRLYEFIKKNGGTFRSGNAELYLKAADKIIRGTIEEKLDTTVKESPLGDLSCPALEAKLKKGVEALVSADCDLLDGFIPVMTESEVCFSAGEIEFEGRIDRISQSEDGESTVVVDYKRGSCPSAKDCTPDSNGKIKDFQMPFYVFLCREKLKKDVTKAWFFNVANERYIRILDYADDPVIKPSTGNGFKSKEELEPAIEAMRKEAAAFAKAISSANFSAKDVYASTCHDCGYRTVCRHAYAVARD